MVEKGITIAIPSDIHFSEIQKISEALNISVEEVMSIQIKEETDKFTLINIERMAQELGISIEEALEHWNIPSDTHSRQDQFKNKIEELALRDSFESKPIFLNEPRDNPLIDHYHGLGNSKKNRNKRKFFKSK